MAGSWAAVQEKLQKSDGNDVVLAQIIIDREELKSYFSVEITLFTIYLYDQLVEITLSKSQLIRSC